MRRRVVDTAGRSDPGQWEELVAGALTEAPPYRPAPDSPVYHISADDRVILVDERDLTEPLAALIAAVMGMGDEISG